MILVIADVAGHDDHDDGMGRINDGGNVIVVVADVLLIGPVFLGDGEAVLQGEIQILLRLGLQHAVDHPGEALLPALIESLHHLGHEAGGVIAAVIKLAGEIVLRQVGEGNGLIAALAAAAAAQVACQHMAIVIVGVDQGTLLQILHRTALDGVLGGELAGHLPLAHQHAHGHLVEAGRVHEHVGVIIPAFAGGGAAEADGEILPVPIQSLTAAVLVHPFGEIVPVDEARCRTALLCQSGGGEGQEQSQDQQQGQKGFFHGVPLFRVISIHYTIRTKDLWYQASCFSAAA